MQSKMTKADFESFVEQVRQALRDGDDFYECKGCGDFCSDKNVLKDGLCEKCRGNEDAKQNN